MPGGSKDPVVQANIGEFDQLVIGTGDGGEGNGTVTIANTTRTLTNNGLIVYNKIPKPGTSGATAAITYIDQAPIAEYMFAWGNFGTGSVTYTEGVDTDFVLAASLAGNLVISNALPGILNVNGLGPLSLLDELEPDVFNFDMTVQFEVVTNNSTTQSLIRFEPRKTTDPTVSQVITSIQGQVSIPAGETGVYETRVKCYLINFGDYANDPTGS